MTQISLQLDPGVESWNYMVSQPTKESVLTPLIAVFANSVSSRLSQRENVWKHFRFTNRTTRLSLIWGVLVPVGVYAIALKQDVSKSVVKAG